MNFFYPFICLQHNILKKEINRIYLVAQKFHWKCSVCCSILLFEPFSIDVNYFQNTIPLSLATLALMIHFSVLQNTSSEYTQRFCLWYLCVIYMQNIKLFQSVWGSRLMKISALRYLSYNCRFLCAWERIKYC